MEQRLQKRISKNLLAKIMMTTKEFFAYVQDITKTGMCIAVNRKLELGDAFEIDLNIPQMKTMRLAGHVAWVKDLPKISRNKYLVGVKLTERPPAYEEYVEELIRRDYERRKDVRYRDTLEIVSEEIIDLLEAATSDVSAGGLYIRTNRPLPVGAQFELALKSQTITEPIYCLVEVLYTFSTDPDDLDHAFGAGVKIISFKEGDKERFRDYLKSLESIYQFHWPPQSEIAGG